MQIASIAFLTGLVLVHSAAAGACVRNEFGVFEDLGCAAEAFADADRDMNRTYQALPRSLEPDQKKLLVQSQRAWLAFVKAQSAFMYSVEGEGAEGRLVVINANEEETRTRAKELASWKITR